MLIMHTRQINPDSSQHVNNFMLGSYLIGGWFYGYPRGIFISLLSLECSKNCFEGQKIMV